MKRRKYIVAILIAANIYIFGGLYNLFYFPEHTNETAHFKIHYSCSTETASHIGNTLESLYALYKNYFSHDFTFSHDHKLVHCVYKDRDQFRKHAILVPRWAEAYYRLGTCNEYFNEDVISPNHWFVHEAVHQLNKEIAHLNIPTWVDEGLAEYFSTAHIEAGQIQIGTIDTDTYPIWWINRNDYDRFAPGETSGVMFPLRNIVEDRDLPNKNKYFNYYYINWWSITYFLFQYENGKYRNGYIQLIKNGCTAENFEKYIGKIETIQNEMITYMKNDIAPEIEKQQKITRPTWANRKRWEKLKKRKRAGSKNI